MWFVVSDLFIALFLNYIPTGHLPAVPDFVALVLAFWCMRQPLKIGIGAGFVFGLLTDIGVGAAMGQHAFSYVLLAYAANEPVAAGAVVHAGRAGAHVLPLLFMSQVVMVVVRLLAGPSSPAGGCSSAALWPPCCGFPCTTCCCCPVPADGAMRIGRSSAGA